MARSRLRRGPDRPARPRLRLVAALCVLAAGACSSSVEVAAPEGPPPTTARPVRAVPDPVSGALRAEIPAPDDPRPGALEHEVLVYGDSVAVLVADDLAAELDAPLAVDAVDCRRLDRGFTGPCGGVPPGTVVASALADLEPAVAGLDDAGTAVAVVVIANNAALDAADLDAAMAATSPLHRVWWVTTRVDGRGWQDPNNRLLAELAQRDPRAGVIDWFTASEGRGWLADHVHPNDAGQAALADLVAAHLRCDCTP